MQPSTSDMTRVIVTASSFGDRQYRCTLPRLQHAVVLHCGDLKCDLIQTEGIRQHTGVYNSRCAVLSIAQGIAR